VIAVLVAAVVVGVAYLVRRRRIWVGRFREATPIHKEYWRGRRGETGELLYVAVGDSAAQGIGASAPDQGYVGILADRIGDSTGETVRVVNLGIVGGTLRTALDSELPTFRKLAPDIVTVSIGANNILVFDAAVFEHDLRELLAAMPPHAIVADLPSFHILPAERNVRRANVILRGIAAEFGMTVVPLHAATSRLSSVIRDFAGDLFHPNDRGYRAWARAFEPAIDARLSQLADRAR